MLHSYEYYSRINICGQHCSQLKIMLNLSMRLILFESIIIYYYNSEQNITTNVLIFTLQISTIKTSIYVLKI